MRPQAPKRSSKRRREPKRTARKSKKAEKIRSKAIAFLVDWSEKHVPVELVAGRSGLKIMGYLSKMQLDPSHDDFIFKTPFGIMALVFPMIYDDVRVDELLLDKPVVFLSNPRFPDDGLRLEAHPSYAASTEQAKKAGEIFGIWIQEGAKVIVTIGDELRVSGCVCEMTKAGENSFVLTDRQAKAIHIVFPEESGIIEIEHRESGAEVTLYSRRSNSHITIRKAPEGAVESTEELLVRYPMANRFVH
jgi:hypothetical protein